MGSLMDKINYLAATKEEIAKAITDKNVEIPAGTTFREYAGLISSISGGGGDGEEDEKYKLGVLTLTSENLEKKEYWARADGFYGYEYVDCTGLDGGGGGNLGTLSVTENGTYQASDEELDGYSAVLVNIPPIVVDGGSNKNPIVPYSLSIRTDIGTYDFIKLTSFKIYEIDDSNAEQVNLGYEYSTSYNTIKSDIAGVPFCTNRNKSFGVFFKNQPESYSGGTLHSISSGDKSGFVIFVYESIYTNPNGYISWDTTYSTMGMYPGLQAEIISHCYDADTLSDKGGIVSITHLNDETGTPVQIELPAYLCICNSSAGFNNNLAPYEKLADNYSSTGKSAYVIHGIITDDSIKNAVLSGEGIVNVTDVMKADDVVSITSTVNFKNYDNSILQTVTNVPLLGQAKYTGETPKPANYDPADPYGCDQFIGWYPSPTFITGNTDCEARFIPSVLYGDGYGYRKCVNGTVSYLNTMDSMNRFTYTATSEKQYMFFINNREGFFGNNTMDQSVFGWLCSDGTCGMTTQNCIRGEVTGDVQCNVVSDIGSIIHLFQQDPNAFFAKAHTGGSVIHDTWEEICANKGAKYNIGDYKMLYLGSTWGHFKMIKVYEGEDGSTSTWLSLSAVPEQVTTSSDLSTDWMNWSLRTWLNTTFFSKLPSVLQSAIIPVRKRHAIANQGLTVLSSSIDSIWSPSLRELVPDVVWSDNGDSMFLQKLANSNSLKTIVESAFAVEKNQITYSKAIGYPFTTKNPLGNYAASGPSNRPGTYKVMRTRSCPYAQYSGKVGGLIEINNGAGNPDCFASMYVGWTYAESANPWFGFCL